MVWVCMCIWCVCIWCGVYVYMVCMCIGCGVYVYRCGVCVYMAWVCMCIWCVCSLVVAKLWCVGVGVDRYMGFTPNQSECWCLLVH